MRATSTTPPMIRPFPRAGRSYVPTFCGPRSAILDSFGTRQPPPPAPVHSSPCGVLLQSTRHDVGDWGIQAICIPRARAPVARAQRQVPGRPVRGHMRLTNSTTYRRSNSRKRKWVTEPTHTCPAPCATPVYALTRQRERRRPTLSLTCVRPMLGWCDNRGPRGREQTMW